MQGPKTIVSASPRLCENGMSPSNNSPYFTAAAPACRTRSLGHDIQLMLTAATSQNTQIRPHLRTRSPAAGAGMLPRCSWASLATGHPPAKAAAHAALMRPLTAAEAQADLRSEANASMALDVALCSHKT